jgi:hypothetical protein
MFAKYYQMHRWHGHLGLERVAMGYGNRFDTISFKMDLFRCAYFSVGVKPTILMWLDPKEHQAVLDTTSKEKNAESDGKVALKSSVRPILAVLLITTATLHTPY